MHKFIHYVTHPKTCVFFLALGLVLMVLTFVMTSIIPPYPPESYPTNALRSLFLVGLISFVFSALASVFRDSLRFPEVK